jgi:hypothetical protein
MSLKLVFKVLLDDPQEKRHLLLTHFSQFRDCLAAYKAQTILRHFSEAKPSLIISPHCLKSASHARFQALVCS